ncbi:MAG TPA: molybdopterin cofactor-binding domain-containing protein [Vicinamibacterales bacterium]|jgi:CO/xanthine dehydrogenase Mo-binding subunit
MTPHAARALAREGFSRRDFLARSGALIISFRASGLLERALDAQGPFDTRASHVDPRQLDSWIAVAADGRVTAFTGKCELGQGMLTAQTQLVAEELSVPISRVHLVMCDTDVCPDQGTTSGSQSTPTNFNEGSLALAAATAREALVKLAAARLNLPADQLIAADGAVASRADRARRVLYGDLVAGRKLNLPLDGSAKRKPPREWTVLGTPVPRLDMAAMATGAFEYVHNVRRPGMAHGAVVRPPSVGATVASVDEGSVRGMAGVVTVVVKGNFVGIVAEKPWQAIQAAAKLRVNWRTPATLPAQASFYDHMRTQPSRDAFTVRSKDVDDKLKGAASTLTATYLHPFQMHGSMGSSCAVAEVASGTVTVWSATQSAYPTRSGVARVLNVPVETVRVIFTRGSGCYGINGADTVSYDAALLSQAAGRPVRVQLSRQDEMAWENYGFPYVIDERVGIDASGAIVAWDTEAWFASLGGRPGYDAPGNVVTGMLAGFPTAPFRPGAAAEPSGEFRNGSNAAPSYVVGRVGARAGGTGTIASERVLTHTVASPFFTGPLRSPSRLQNTFAHESFMDEIAARVKADPVEYRLRHLADDRLREVVSRAAKAAGWDTRPSPRPGSTRTGVVTGRGISAVAYEGDNGYVAMVAIVEVDQATGAITAKRLVVAQDCGPISNPDGMRNQVEGGALHGLSRVLGEEVTWDDRRVTSIDWRTYHTLPLGFSVPAIETVLINRDDVRATGAGETAITVVAAAIGNAVFDATGVRLRQVPLTPDRVRAALALRA